jgi:hypothetical protein
MSEPAELEIDDHWEKRLRKDPLTICRVFGDALQLMQRLADNAKEGDTFELDCYDWWLFTKIWEAREYCLNEDYWLDDRFKAVPHGNPEDGECSVIIWDWSCVEDKLANGADLDDDDWSRLGNNSREIFARPQEDCPTFH